ncbi:hypothetical protein BD779DRAFT_1522808 [Infundibulicybe gibba]|nr:hypothetical protein BD779DRAFT_1522808 [Infundibulicybe gibba]
MFQVASHPSSFVHGAAHSHSAHRHAAPSAQQPVQLPRTLARPPFTDISRKAIAAAAPELANVPAEYIRSGLRSKASQMLAGNSKLSLPPSVPKSQIPPSLTVPVRPSSSTYPTHLLAISASKPTSSNESATLVPVHSLVLAAHCALLPPLPAPAGAATGTLHLPILPLALPSPAAFTLLHAYMYTHSLPNLLGALIPLPPAFLSALPPLAAALASGPALHQLSAHLASASGENLAALTRHAAHVKELWQDVAALGIHDPELWDAIDLAWEVVLGAMNIAAASRN